MTEPETHLTVIPAVTVPDRWSRTKMAEFLRVLGATHSVSEAARSVGVSRQSAYRLRARLRGEPFDIAWDAALQSGYEALRQAALERALHGVELPVYHRGELIGTRRAFDERLTVFLLSDRNRHRQPMSHLQSERQRNWSARFDDLVERVRLGQPFGRGE
jgi:hypothetical protein